MGTRAGSPRLAVRLNFPYQSIKSLVIAGRVSGQTMQIDQRLGSTVPEAPPAAGRAGFRSWVKARQTPAARLIYGLGMAVRRMRVPQVNAIHRPLYMLDRLVRSTMGDALRIVWYTPLFQSRLKGYAPGLAVTGGIPLVMGDLEIEFGRDCNISGKTTLSGRIGGGLTPRLTVGDNCVIGWQNTISVGTRVVIGNNVFMASNCSLIGYPGHPLDPVARANHLPDTDDQTGDIVLEDDVWLATGVTVMPGVRIGRGTIVGAGSVVTKDLPEMTIAAGVPAVVRRRLESGPPASAQRDAIRVEAK